jgi:hypothetical protein
MAGSDLIWGLALIALGVFVCSYGNMLFRFALPALAFGLASVMVYGLLDSMDALPRVGISLGLGLIAAMVLFLGARIAIYVAGGLLGVVAAMLLASLIDLAGSRPSEWIVYPLVIAGAGGGGYIGPRFGAWITVLATATGGAFLAVAGILRLFQSTFGRDITSPVDVLNSKVTIVVFLVIAIISALTQYNFWRLRANVLRR